MVQIAESRRRFIANFASTSLGTTLLPGVLWARMQDAGTTRVTPAMVADALKLSGIDLSDEQRQDVLETANRNLARSSESRKIEIPPDVSPPFHFSPIVPGVKVNTKRLPFRLSAVPGIKRPGRLEDIAFWPVRHLAELIRTRQVTSQELTEMYLARLHRHNSLLNNVITFLDELGLADAKRADAEIAAGKYKGPLHGIPYGVKDLIAVKGYKTTWGAAAFKDQVFDYDATVVQQLRDAGAILIAKLTTGELAVGDQWFGGRTKSPWDPTQGSSGSSAGSASATAAGGIAFAIGVEGNGSILTPSARCGVGGLRPTFGRISRHGSMGVMWTMDRVGPICRYAEDCAIVMQAVAKRDERDMSVTDVPFNWDAQLDVRQLNVGIVKKSFDEITNRAAKENAAKMLEAFRSLGVREFIPITVPDLAADILPLTRQSESAAQFDAQARAHRMGGTNRAADLAQGWLLPTPEYLQIQRLRTMMMMQLASATAKVDVYLVGSNSIGMDGIPAGASTDRHFTQASLAGYPGLNLPNGFTETGTPTNAVIYAQPFRELEMIALAMAYQDAARFHLQRPTAAS